VTVIGRLFLAPLLLTSTHPPTHLYLTNASKPPIAWGFGYSNGHSHRPRAV
jgi:hypothetical protein